MNWFIHFNFLSLCVLVLIWGSGRHGGICTEKQLVQVLDTCGLDPSHKSYPCSTELNFSLSKLNLANGYWTFVICMTLCYLLCSYSTLYIFLSKHSVNQIAAVGLEFAFLTRMRHRVCFSKCIQCSVQHQGQKGCSIYVGRTNKYFKRNRDK